MEKNVSDSRLERTDATLVNLSHGDINDPNFVSQSVLAAMGIAPTGNISDENDGLNNLLSRLLAGENPAKVYRELENILKTRNLR